MAKPLLTDELWELIEPCLPPPRPRPKGGRKPIDHRRTLTGILFVLKTGIPWEDLPQEMGWSSWGRPGSERQLCGVSWALTRVEGCQGVTEYSISSENHVAADPLSDPLFRRDSAESTVTSPRAGGAFPPTLLIILARFENGLDRLVWRLPRARLPARSFRPASANE